MLETTPQYQAFNAEFTTLYQFISLTYVFISKDFVVVTQFCKCWGLLTINNNSIRLGSVRECQNRTIIPLKPRLRGLISLFKLGQISKF